MDHKQKDFIRIEILMGIVVVETLVIVLVSFLMP